MMHRLLFAAALAALASPALAQDVKPEAAPAADISLQAVTCPEGTSAPHEREDTDLVVNVQRAFQQASFPAIRAYLPRLREAMDHAPACYPEIERRGDEIIIRSDDSGQSLTLNVALAALAASNGENIRIVQNDNIYMWTSFLLGSYANEMHQYDEAITWLDRGLALQPHAQYLVSEKSMALSELGRKEEAHALLRGELDSGANLALDRARFERMDGILLIDLQRLDEAEAALNESIRLLPNNPIARSELQYIAQLRAGQASRGNAQITAPHAPVPETQ
jgi:tetratricopeptide (TPR) repeat protein